MVSDMNKYDYDCEQLPWNG